MPEGWNRLHPTVAATLAGLAAAAAVTALERAGWAGAAAVRGWLVRLDFNALLMRGLLCFLLFAGSLHVDSEALAEAAWPVALLSTVGVLASTILVGWGMRVVLPSFGPRVPLLPCLLFGALISPTDPVAVLAIFRRAKVPAELAALVAAESLFNDGMAVVVFSAILGASADGGPISVGRAARLFLAQTGGGLALGWLLGALCRWCVDRAPSATGRFAATAAAAWIGYSAAAAVGASGLLAAIVAGIRVGGRDPRLKAVWTAVDGALNIALFGLLGLMALAVPWTRESLAAGLAAVPVVLAGRAVGVGGLLAAMRPWRTFAPGTFRALTWGGLRGAIPFALAWALWGGHPAGAADAGMGAVLLGATYFVGVFSLLVQGSTI